tara:strand:- start:843 stop:1043 length:201 start_codon:yes stop_codon:yes gene_type:complete
MNIILNNQLEKIPETYTVKNLLADKNIKTKYFAVEINRNIVPKSTYCKYYLKENDKVEIITAIGGG